MVQTRPAIPILPDGSVDIDTWLNHLQLSPKTHLLLHNACNLAKIMGEDQKTPYNSNCLQYGLELAEILVELNMDAEMMAAAIIYITAKYTHLRIEDIEDQLGRQVTKLIHGVSHLDMIHLSGEQHVRYNDQQIDNLRKIFLAMVRDVRVVVIKLAERLLLLRSLKNNMSKEYQKHTAQETLDIFAPLANRLGLHPVKWELEDRAFFYLEPEIYMKIARGLDEKRSAREKRVQFIIQTIENMLYKSNIVGEVYGRAKHLYSIRKKMLRKNVDLSEIYDTIAVRVLVAKIDQCYTVLSFIHEKWTPIQEEFDDYIATPKPNGYQSIHTAVFDENGKPFEVQIRTNQMHQDAELGVAAHWMYKEGGTKADNVSGYEEKIVWLRQLLAWQKEVIHQHTLPEQLEKDIFEDRVYVFTPEGEIIDLPTGATPLDFAYHVHTQIGHRCRGAEVDGKIVPLTYILKTGERVKILTMREPSPSRDWILPKRGYLKTSTARAKVLQWFRKLDKAATPMPPETLTAAEITAPAAVTITTTETRPTKHQSAISFGGIDHVLSKIAKCCKPLPGDPIQGYITQNQGVTIHHAQCKNLVYAQNHHPGRLTPITWNKQKANEVFAADLEILATDNPHFIHDITTLLANEKIKLLNLTMQNIQTHRRILITIEIPHLEALTSILQKLQQLPNIHTVKRL